MMESDDGSGRFTSVTLRPHILITRTQDLEKAHSLHHEAHAKCFIANSVNVPVRVEATISAADQPAR